MKKWLVIMMVMTGAANVATAQCSICTKTAEQMGELPGKGLNAGILYLAAAPLGIASFIGYKWWKKEKEINE